MMANSVTIVGRLVIAGAAIGVISFAAAALAQGASSPSMAKELVTLLTERQLDAFAVQDPEAPNSFLATLVIPGAQMLVVSAEYPSPDELQAQLAQKNYRDVYTALHQPTTASSRFFLIDAGCDGLDGDSDGVDVLYEKGTAQTVFDGDWKKQGISEATYRERLERAEKRYSRVLRLFRDTLKATAAPAPIVK
jgi:hypothetical protein